MTIAPELVNLSPADAFKYYRDELRWQVYPVHPPTAKVSDAGKAAAVRAWWNYDSRHCDLGRYFQNGRSYNIGLAPKGGLLVIDLDSKSDQGESVRKFLDEHPQIGAIPRQVTRGGVHLLLRCPDLPRWKNSDGKPYHKALVGRINDKVTAELFHCDHQNVVIPPSVHPSGFHYAWERTGEVTEDLWKPMRDLFCFEEPEGPQPKAKKKSGPWHLHFRGELSSLDLVGLLEELGFPAKPIDSDSGKHTLRCPWHAEHTGGKEGGTSTVLWQRDGRRPEFHCSHAHCAERKLKEVLEWAESEDAGIVDRFCTRTRVWEEDQTSLDGRPRILHAIGRLESEVYRDVGQAIGHRHAWFVRAGEVNVIEQVASGFKYSTDPDTQYTVSAHTLGFRVLNGIQAKGNLEKYVEPGILVKSDNGDDDADPEFLPKSFSTDFCAGLIQADQLKEELPLIARILTVALPFRVGDKLIYPRSGYDRRLATYLAPNAPAIQPMALERALKILDRIHSGFCFTNEQSRTHALARLITPFGRALLGWTTRVPLWFYSANRPRAGKDYLHGITLIVYEGIAFEDLPIGRESEETGKRIMAAARSGRRFMHFSNCQIHLQDQYLTAAITNPMLNGRRLGSNDATSDLSIPNEMEFSISANIGLTYREDIEPRLRKIELAFFDEDPNARTFTDKFLHRTVKENRATILSAIAALYDNWALAGFPVGRTSFTSYPEWADIVGGVMTAAGRGDPCLPFHGSYDEGGDLKTEAMRALFAVCHKAFGETWIGKPQIYQCVEKAAEENEALRWLGSLEGTEDARKNQTRLGMFLVQFKNRILGSIQLFADDSAGKSQRRQFRFAQIGLDTLGTLGTFNGSLVTREEINVCHTHDDVCATHVYTRIYVSDPL